MKRISCRAPLNDDKLTCIGRDSLASVDDHGCGIQPRRDGFQHDATRLLIRLNDRQRHTMKSFPLFCLEGLVTNLVSIIDACNGSRTAYLKLDEVISHRHKYPIL